MAAIGYINPLEQLARNNVEMNQALQDSGFAQELMSLAVLGYGDPATARYLITVSSSQIGFLRQQYDFFIDQVKEDKKSMGKAWDLLKDS